MYLRFSIRRAKKGRTLVSQIFISERVNGIVKKRLICHLGSLSLSLIEEEFFIKSYLKSCEQKIESHLNDPAAKENLKSALREKLNKFLCGHSKIDININRGLNHDF